MAGFGERFVGAGLVGTERAAALQHQHDAFAACDRPTIVPLRDLVRDFAAASSRSMAEVKRKWGIAPWFTVGWLRQGMLTG
jgi:hypothetical protein